MPRPPVRTCIGCRTAGPAAELVRLIAPDGVVGMAPRGPGQGVTGKRGRGAWAHPRCLDQALTTAALGRAFRRQVEVSDREALLAQAHSAHGRSTDVQGDPR